MRHVGIKTPLNVYFAGDWELLSLTWNGVGISSISKWLDPDRQKFPLEQLISLDRVIQPWSIC